MQISLDSTTPQRLMGVVHSSLAAHSTLTSPLKIVTHIFLSVEIKIILN